MSEYNRKAVEKDFCMRTQKNLKYIQNRVLEERGQGKKDYEIKDVYEVTQLINSFVGLLMIPLAKHYDLLGEKEFERDSAVGAIIESLKRDSSRYSNNYLIGETDKREELTPRTLARHLRNAVAHNRLKFMPNRKEEGMPIEKIEFKDKDYRNNRNEKFRVVLTVEEIEVLLYALSDLLFC